MYFRPYLLLLFACGFLPGILFAQSSLTLSIDQAPLSAQLQELSKPRAAIAADHLLNERILDLVEVEVLDSILTKKKQRHRFFGSPLAQFFGGIRWESINMRKEKYIGTAARRVSIANGMFKEYDINFFLIPGLDRYINLLDQGYTTTEGIGRNMDHCKVYDPPFACDERLRYKDIGYKSIECECTPHLAYRPALNTLFYPTEWGNLKTHPNFGEPHPSIGVYGAFALDCNHNCRPEIHPYEWIWWLDLQATRPDTMQKVWMLGLIRDASERFRDWTPSPRTGHISIPFVFPLDDDQYTIRLEHLVHDRFVPEGLAQLESVPTDSWKPDFMYKEIALEGLPEKKLQIETSQLIQSEGYKLWLSNLKTDQSVGMLSGELHIALSVENLYTARVIFSSK